jgi:enolase
VSSVRARSLKVRICRSSSDATEHERTRTIHECDHCDHAAHARHGRSTLAPLLRTARPWTFCWRVIERCGLEPGADAAIAVDIAATQLLVDGTYVLASENRRPRASQLVDALAAWDDYPIVSIEDALGADDEEGRRLATARLAGGIQLLGDDMFATSSTRLEAGIRDGIANAVLVKPKQVGTLSEARQVVAVAQDAAYATVLSARSGGTEDSWLADLAVG